MRRWIAGDGAVSAIVGVVVVCITAAAWAQPRELELAHTAAQDLYLSRRPALPESPKLPEVLENLLKEKEARAEERRKLAIKLLREFLGTKPTGLGRAEGLFKLAELLWEDSRVTYLSGMLAFDRKLEACRQRRPSCKRKPKEPSLNLREPEKHYRTILRDHPDYPRTDLVLFLTGFAVQERGDTIKAIPYFQRVIDEHPDSPLYPDAWMMKGEQFFANDRWKEARGAFEVVLKHPDSQAFDLALFKSAWCDWKLGETERAAKRFKQVLDLAAEAERSGTARERRRRSQLRDEALNYLVLVFTEDDNIKPKEVYDFLASIGGERYSRDVLTRLADVLYNQAAYDRSVATFRFLIQLDATHAKAATFQRRIVEIQLESLSPAEAMNEIKALVENYGPGSDWAEANKKRRTLVRRQHDAAERFVRKVAKGFHAEAQQDEGRGKRPNLKLYKRAATTYEYYLTRFGNHRNAAEVQYLRGDILFFKTKSFEPAGDAYLTVGKSSPVGKYHKDALLKAMEAFERARPDKLKRNAEGKIVLPPVDRKFADAVDLYATLFPADPQLVNVIYRNGERFYDYGEYDEAVKRFGIIVTKYPNHENAGAAGDRILDALNKSADYENIETWARKLKKTKGFSGSKQQARLDRLIIESIGKSGEKYAQAGKYKRAAKFYERIPKEYPKHSLAPQSLFNAAVMYEKAKEPERAARAYLRMSAAYPRDRRAANAAYTAARVYEAAAYFEKAAEAYEAVSKTRTTRKSRTKAGDALFNAGLLRQALGQHRRAIEHYEQYARMFKKRDNAEEVAFRVGVVYENAGDHGRAQRAFASYLKRYRRSTYLVQAHTRAGRNAIALGKDKRAAKHFKSAIALFKRSKGDVQQAALAWAAEARYQQGELLYKRYAAIKLDIKPSKLQRTLKRKTKMLTDAQVLYVNVVEYGDPKWATAALYRIGAIFEEFANALREAPTPGGFSKEDAELYRQELDNFVIDIEERAIERYTLGYEKAMELQVYNEYTQKIRKALGRLAPSQFPPEREVRGKRRAGERTPTAFVIEEVVRE